MRNKFDDPDLEELYIDCIVENTLPNCRTNGLPDHWIATHTNGVLVREPNLVNANAGSCQIRKLSVKSKVDDQQSRIRLRRS